jgi:hypothetical protein
MLSSFTRVANRSRAKSDVRGLESEPNSLCILTCFSGDKRTPAVTASGIGHAPCRMSQDFPVLLISIPNSDVFTGKTRDACLCRVIGMMMVSRTNALLRGLLAPGARLAEQRLCAAQGMMAEVHELTS